MHDSLTTQCLRPVHWKMAKMTKPNQPTRDHALSTREEVEQVSGWSEWGQKNGPSKVRVLLPPDVGVCCRGEEGSR